MAKLAKTDLILNPDGSIYHLNLLPEDIAQTIITVGDLDRVAEVSKHFDSIEVKKGKREFITHTGYIGKKRITVISTGIGTDNIDIVLNELDALTNIDFASREIKSKLKSLDIIRIGTSGTLQENIQVGTILASSFGLGLDSLMNYYPYTPSAKETILLNAIEQHLKDSCIPKPYLAKGDEDLLNRIAFDLEKGITVTAPGFYAPQGRALRAKNAIPNYIATLKKFQFEGHGITNLEMETAGIYALANGLGHRAISINAILANRVKLEFAKNPQTVIDKAIITVLERLE
jgi:uridine phosphorylase